MYWSIDHEQIHTQLQPERSFDWDPLLAAQGTLGELKASVYLLIFGLTGAT
jgi:hypothetical protein